MRARSARFPAAASRSADPESAARRDTIAASKIAVAATEINLAASRSQSRAANRPPPKRGVILRAINALQDLDRELKYLLPAGRVPFVERWLTTVCPADPVHGCSDVWTVYYDTGGQQSLHEKLNSDYFKTKLRVRWYAPPGGAAAGDAFVEVKRRIGDRREKIRVALPGAAASLAGRPLDDAIWRDVPRHLAAEGITGTARWHPVLALVYRRSRFLDAASGARVSCDSGIRAAGVARSERATWRPDPLDLGVIEVKGGSDELPRSLRTITRFGARLASFSKYAAVWTHVRPGAI